MIKILVTGFKHSGTTMLMELLKTHPQVADIEFEKSYIQYDKPKQWILMFAKKSAKNLEKYVWGEKIPWGTQREDYNATRSINFTQKWLRFFGKEARVIHIIRHPMDVSLSRYPLPVSKNNLIIDETMLQYCLNSVPLYLAFISSYKQCATVVYEDLLLNPKDHLGKIFLFLGLKFDGKILDDAVDKVKPDLSRAYAFKEKEIEDNIDYNSILERIKIRV